MSLFATKITTWRHSGLLCCALLLSACAGNTVYTTEQHHSFALAPDDLPKDGIAFLTPSSITGREQDRQSLALTFAEVFRDKRPDIRVVTLPETISEEGVTFHDIARAIAERMIAAIPYAPDDGVPELR